MGACPLFNGGTLKNLTMQVISGSMCKSIYIGHNVHEIVGPQKGKMSYQSTYNYDLDFPTLTPLCHILYQ